MSKIAITSYTFPVVNVDYVDLDAAVAQGIAVCNIPDYRIVNGVSA
jgi:lactate dehydrogenase-like 2-hydroxyacid dehydrogenase